MMIRKETLTLLIQEARLQNTTHEELADKIISLALVQFAMERAQKAPQPKKLPYDEVTATYKTK